MNKYRLIWGIVCLVVAGVLVVLNLTLPPESIMFTLGEQNMPWVPPVVFGIIGIILLVSARGDGQAAEKPQQPKPVIDPEKAALNKRLESIAWGCFLVLLGGLMFIPDNVVTDGLWSIGVGLIMLGLNIARYLNNLKMSGFTTFLGILSLVGGIAQIFIEGDFEGAFLLIILGLYLIFKQWFDQRKLFGKAEEA